jgi:hypothetical protein
MDARMIGAGDAVAMAAARDNDEGLKRTRLQVLAHIGNHNCGTLVGSALRRKRREPIKSGTNFQIGDPVPMITGLKQQRYRWVAASGLLDHIILSFRDHPELA